MGGTGSIAGAKPASAELGRSTVMRATSVGDVYASTEVCVANGGTGATVMSRPMAVVARRKKRMSALCAVGAAPECRVNLSSTDE